MAICLTFKTETKMKYIIYEIEKKDIVVLRKVYLRDFQCEHSTMEGAIDEIKRKRNSDSGEFRPIYTGALKRIEDMKLTILPIF